MTKHEGVRFLLDDGKGYSASFVYRPPKDNSKPLAMDTIFPNKHGEIIKHKVKDEFPKKDL